MSHPQAIVTTSDIPYAHLCLVQVVHKHPIHTTGLGNELYSGKLKVRSDLIFRWLGVDLRVAISRETQHS